MDTTAQKEGEKKRVITELLKPLSRVQAWADRTGPNTPAEQRQRELFDRWAGARTLVDAPTASEEPPAASGGGTTPPKP